MNMKPDRKPYQLYNKTLSKPVFSYHGQDVQTLVLDGPDFQFHVKGL